MPSWSTAVSDGTIAATLTPRTSSGPSASQGLPGTAPPGVGGVVLEAARRRDSERVGHPGAGDHGAVLVGRDGFDR